MRTASAGARSGGWRWRTSLRRKPFMMSAVCCARRTLGRSVTPLLKSRFDKQRPRAFEALVESYRSQIIEEWAKRFPGLPLPSVEPLVDARNASRFVVQVGVVFARTRRRRGGVQPDAAGGGFRLTFERNLPGPIALGWGAHFGLGLLAGECAGRTRGFTCVVGQSLRGTGDSAVLEGLHRAIDQFASSPTAVRHFSPLWIGAFGGRFLIGLTRPTYEARRTSRGQGIAGRAGRRRESERLRAELADLQRARARRHHLALLGRARLTLNIDIA